MTNENEGITVGFPLNLDLPKHEFSHSVKKQIEEIRDRAYTEVDAQYTSILFEPIVKAFLLKYPDQGYGRFVADMDFDYETIVSEIRGMISRDPECDTPFLSLLLGMKIILQAFGLHEE